MIWGLDTEPLQTLSLDDKEDSPDSGLGKADDWYTCGFGLELIPPSIRVGKSLPTAQMALASSRPT